MDIAAVTLVLGPEEDKLRQLDDCIDCWCELRTGGSAGVPSAAGCWSCSGPSRAAPRRGWWARSRSRGKTAAKNWKGVITSGLDPKPIKARRIMVSRLQQLPSLPISVRFLRTWMRDHCAKAQNCIRGKSHPTKPFGALNHENAGAIPYS